MTAAKPADRETLDRSLATLAIRRRDIILESIATSAKELLRSGDVLRSIPKVLESIGTATNVERAHLLVVDIASSLNEQRVVDHHVWSAPGVVTSGLFRDGRDLRFVDVGLATWLPRLARGETIAGFVRGFEEPVRKFFAAGGVKSTVAVPMFVDDVWWGMIAFDACRDEREWLPTEIDTLKILAELVGAALARSRRLQRLTDASRIIENSPTVLFRLSATAPHPLIFVSQNIRQYGYEADALLATPHRWLQLIEEGDLAAALALINSMVEGRTDRDRLELRLRRPDGRFVWFEGESTVLRDDSGHVFGIEGILTDITERKCASERFAALARTDALTGLANRVAFLERLRSAFARAERGNSAFAVLYLDLDHFKDVNDTLGHAGGDALLQAVARRLKDCVRESDATARFGGDEFAVLQEDVTDIFGIEALADKIGRTLSAPYAIMGNMIHITASVGVVPYSADVTDPDAMLVKADLALYRAKAEGRNQFRLYAPELDQKAQEEMLIGRDLHGAVERNEFELWYQPQVALASGQIVGLEALIRWNHPKRGFLPPDTFIPIAESNGTISAIGAWVVDEACRQAALWRRDGIMPATMAVNVSASQFRLAGAFDHVLKAALDAHAIRPGELEVELTETVLMETVQKHGDAFERLRGIGVRLAIDDFGTGFSSLDYLRSFRVARLKLASRFVDEIATNPDDAAIVRATIRLANELGIDVVAEGVSNVEQQSHLLAAGCTYAQGYYFGKPMPASRMGGLLREKRLPGASATGDGN